MEFTKKTLFGGLDNPSIFITAETVNIDSLSSQTGIS